MNLHLDRRGNEKVWNVLQEIRDILIGPKKQKRIPLLGSWVLNRYNEGVRGPALKALIAKRIWAFEFVADKGVIQLEKTPRPGDLKGEFIFIIDKEKFNKFYKSCEKSYKSKAAIYQQGAKEETGLEPKTNPKDSGEYKEEGGNGYLVIGHKKIPIGEIDTRRSKFVKHLWHPDRFGQILSVESIFDEIRIGKDSKNIGLNTSATSYKNKERIIDQTIKEIQRIFKRNRISNFQFKRLELFKGKIRYQVILKIP